MFAKAKRSSLFHQIDPKKFYEIDAWNALSLMASCSWSSFTSFRTLAGWRQSWTADTIFIKTFFLFLLSRKHSKVAGVKVYPRQTWNIKSHAVSACIGPIGLWHHRLMHASTEWLGPWHHRPMHAVTAWLCCFHFISYIIYLIYIFFYLYLQLFWKHSAWQP